MHILDTERLSLRWFSVHDAAVVVGLLNDPQWLRYIGDHQVRTEEDARQWIEHRLVNVYRQQGMGMWAVALKDTRELVGMCGLIKRDRLPDIDVGYAFMPAHRGRGYAVEAARACLTHGQQVFGLRRILAITRHDNAASQRVLAAIGLPLYERKLFEGDTQESCVYEWKASGG